MTTSTGNSRTGMILLSILVAFLGLMSIANFYLLLQDKGDIDVSALHEELEVHEAEPPIFVTIGPMTVNLQSSEFGHRLLYAGLSLRVGNEESRELLQVHQPEVHSRLLVLLSAQHAENLTTPTGKEKLIEDIKLMLATPLEEHQPPLSIQSVLFTDFIAQ